MAFDVAADFLDGGLRGAPRIGNGGAHYISRISPRRWAMT